ncbi:MAG: transporter [Alphaproteobacteria bacterium]|nr:transporter [Alphaproteobacteria bacterium]
MKKPLCLALISILALSAATANAEELWNPSLRGVDEGLTPGALPPKGVYFVNNAYFGQWKAYDGSGKATGQKLDVAVDIPVLLWNPGVKVWGADYAVALAQPFDYTSVYSNSTASAGNGHVGTYNTVLVPGMLSWALPYDFHVKTGLAIYVDDPSSSPAHPAPAGGAGAGNSFWTFEPDAALSWLHNGWNLSADMRYDYNLKDESTGYNSGNMIAINYTATKTIGKWTVGAGAYQENQLEKDTLNGATVANSTREAYGAGPIVGYDFGPVSLQGTYNANIMTHHDFGGDFFNLRLIAPLF